MYSPEEYRNAELYRDEWYRSRGYPENVSWNGLPTSQQDDWVRQAIAFDTDDTQQEEVA